MGVSRNNTTTPARTFSSQPCWTIIRVKNHHNTVNKWCDPQADHFVLHMCLCRVALITRSWAESNPSLKLLPLFPRDTASWSNVHVIPKKSLTRENISKCKACLSCFLTFSSVCQTVPLTYNQIINLSSSYSLLLFDHID